MILVKVGLWIMILSLASMAFTAPVGIYKVSGLIFVIGLAICWAGGFVVIFRWIIGKSIKS